MPFIQDVENKRVVMTGEASAGYDVALLDDLRHILTLVVERSNPINLFLSPAKAKVALRAVEFSLKAAHRSYLNIYPEVSPIPKDTLEPADPSYSRKPVQKGRNKRGV